MKDDKKDGFGNMKPKRNRDGYRDKEKFPTDPLSRKRKNVFRRNVEEIIEDDLDDMEEEYDID